MWTVNNLGWTWVPLIIKISAENVFADLLFLTCFTLTLVTSISSIYLSAFLVASMHSWNLLDCILAFFIEWFLTSYHLLASFLLAIELTICLLDSFHSCLLCCLLHAYLNSWFIICRDPCTLLVHFLAFLPVCFHTLKHYCKLLAWLSALLFYYIFAVHLLPFSFVLPYFQTFSQFAFQFSCFVSSSNSSCNFLSCFFLSHLLDCVVFLVASKIAIYLITWLLLFFLKIKHCCKWTSCFLDSLHSWKHSCKLLVCFHHFYQLTLLQFICLLLFFHAWLFPCFLITDFSASIVALNLWSLALLLPYMQTFSRFISLHFCFLFLPDFLLLACFLQTASFLRRFPTSLLSWF